MIDVTCGSNGRSRQPLFTVQLEELGDGGQRATGGAASLRCPMERRASWDHSYSPSVCSLEAISEEEGGPEELAAAEQAQRSAEGRAAEQGQRRNSLERRKRRQAAAFCESVSAPACLHRPPPAPRPPSVPPPKGPPAGLCGFWDEVGCADKRPPTSSSLLCY